MGKNKIARWAELETFKNVFQPEIEEQAGKDYPLKRKWRTEVFMNNNSLILELGCGKGEYTTGLAALFPHNNYIGVDIKGARMWRGAKNAHEAQMPNVAFLRTRIEFIDRFFGEDEIDEIWLTFPDPQAGKRNSNKRLTCPWFMNKYRLFLKDNGIVHLKTDNDELFDYTLRLTRKNNLNLTCSIKDLYSGDISDKILSIRTHYESLYLKDGIKIKYLAFRLVKKNTIRYGTKEATGTK